MKSRNYFGFVKEWLIESLELSLNQTNESVIYWSSLFISYLLMAVGGQLVGNLAAGCGELVLDFL